MASKFGSGSQTLKDASKGTAFSKTVYFSLDDGDSAYVRFLTDYELPLDSDFQIIEGMEHVEAWVTVSQHQGVPTRPKPEFAKEGNKWPERFGVVCRNTKCKGLPGEPPLWSLMEDKDEREGCFVCGMESKEGKPYKASSRGWALGCLREEVRGDGTEAMGGPKKKGKIVGYRDKTREVEKTVDGETKTVTEKAVVVFNMGWKNFFSTLEGFGSHYETVLDRDYKITRQGEGTSTDYQIVPMDPVPGPKGDVYDLRDPEYMARYDIGITLDDVIDEQARDSWHRRWFDPTYTPPTKDDEDKGKSKGSSKSATPSEAEQAKPETDAPDADMESMANRVLNRYGPGDGDQSEAPADDEQQGSGESDGPDAESAPAGATTGLQFIE